MLFRSSRYVPAMVAVLFGALAGLAGAQPPQAVGAHVQAAIGHKVSALVHTASAAMSHVTAHHHPAASGSVQDPRPQVVQQQQVTVPPPSPHLEDPDKADHATNAGIVDGHVISVDYQSGMIGLMTQDRGKVDVMVLPSTNIQGRGDSFHTIADIGRGAHLRVFLSERAGQLFAQIIHLR